MFKLDLGSDPHIFRMYEGQKSQPAYFHHHGHHLIYGDDTTSYKGVIIDKKSLLAIKSHLSEQRIPGYLFFNPEISDSQLSSVSNSIVDLLEQQWAKGFTKPDCPRSSYLVQINPYSDLQFHTDLMSRIRTGAAFQSDHPKQVLFAMELLEKYGQNPLTFKTLIADFASCAGYASWSADSGPESLDDY